MVPCQRPVSVSRFLLELLLRLLLLGGLGYLAMHDFLDDETCADHGFLTQRASLQGQVEP
jgi:hypothetical protein